MGRRSKPAAYLVSSHENHNQRPVNIAHINGKEYLFEVKDGGLGFVTVGIEGLRL